MVALANDQAPGWLRNVCVAGMAIMIAAGASGSLACGYDRDDVSLERVGLDIVYPQALSVLRAMEGAETANRPLSASIVEQQAFAFYQTASSLERLAAALHARRATGPLESFTLVLVEPMLWTRFEMRTPKLGDAVSGNGVSDVSAQIHAPGPRAGELLVVSGAKVIEQIVRNRLSVAEARDLGVLRLYGSDAQISAFMVRYAIIGGEHDSRPGKTNG
jgi:hypothetical protein